MQDRREIPVLGDNSITQNVDLPSAALGHFVILLGVLR